MTFPDQPLYGIVSAEGQEWYDQRKFMFKCLSDLGMGKRDTMEEVIEQESRSLGELFKTKKGQPINSRVCTSLVKLCL